MPNSPSLVITLPTQIQATSATDTSTGAVPFWDVSDAVALSFTVNAATTAAAGTFAEVAYTVDATGPFFKLNYQSQPSSAAALVVTTSSFIVHINPVTFKQIRFGTATVIATTYKYTGAKLVTI